jgi:hypothetical protein
MNLSITRRLGLATAFGLASIGVSHAATAFTNPTPGTTSAQSTVYVSFTATTTGMLQGYFTGSGTTVFTDGMGVYTGGTPDQSSASGVNWSSYTNKTAAFGQALFGSNGIQVTAGETLYFVESVNPGGSWSSNGCASTPSGTYYVWSNESASCAGGVSYSNPLPANYNAMAYTTGYNTYGQTLTGGGGSTGMTAGAIAAGNYTYVGFNDFLYNGSNNYTDFSFLFNITCTTGTVGCNTGNGSNAVPEPGSLALVALGLLGAAGARRRRRA